MYQMCNSSRSRCAPSPPPQPRAEEQAAPNHSESIPQTKPSQVRNPDGSGFPHQCLRSTATGMSLPRKSPGVGSPRGKRTQLGEAGWAWCGLHGCAKS